MTLQIKDKHYNWARCGGLIDERDLDIVKYELDIIFPIKSYDEDTKTYMFAPVEISLNNDLFINPPEEVYTVSWGDDNTVFPYINFREFTADWTHTYVRDDDIINDGKTYTIIIKGRNLIKKANLERYGYITKLERSLTGVFKNHKYYLTLRSVL